MVSRVSIDRANRTPAEGRPAQFVSESVLSGVAEFGETVTVTPGDVVGLPSPSISVKWHVCASLPGTGPLTNCEVIREGPDLSLILDETHIGQFVVAEISVANSLGRDTSVAAIGQRVVSEPRFVGEHVYRIGSATLVGAPQVGQQLGSMFFFGQPGWKSHPLIEQASGDWYRCDSAVAEPTSEVPEGCEPASNQPGILGYVLGLEDIGKFMTIRVAATNSLGSTSLFMPSTPQTQLPVSMVQAPEIVVSGELFAPAPGEVGGTLILDQGDWIGFPNPAVSVEWLRCNGQVTNPPSASCLVIPGVTATSYTLRDQDREWFVTARVTAQNDSGSVTYVVPQTERPGFSPYRMGLSPTITGNDGSSQPTLTLQEIGGWSGNPAPDVTVDWFRCDSSISDAWIDELPAGCVAIPDAQGTTYQAGQSDFGKHVMARVSASNIFATVSIFSKTTGPIYTSGTFPGSPVITEAGYISDPFSDYFAEFVVSVDGFDPSTWGDTAFRWFHCESNPGSDLLGLRESSSGPALPEGCSFIPGESNDTLIVGPELADRFVGVAITVIAALQSGGSATFVLELVTETAIDEEMFPEIVPLLPRGWRESYGSTGVGETIIYLFGSYSTCKKFSWENGEWCMEFDYQWLRDGSPILGASGSGPTALAAYELTADDRGREISIEFKISRPGHRNTFGLEVFPGTVVNGTLTTTPMPTISGENAVGNTLTANLGTWDSGVTFTAMNWYRDGNGVGTGLTYTLTPEDEGRQISFLVAATKPGYNQVVREVYLPSLTSPGTLSASPTLLILSFAQLDNTLQARFAGLSNEAAWDPGTTLSYQWLRNGVPISGAIGANYRLQVGDVGSAVSVRATASKPGYVPVVKTGVLSEARNGGTTVGVDVSIVGDNVNGTTHSIDSNLRAGHLERASLNYEYQWFKCSARVWNASSTLPAGCSPHRPWGLSNQGREGIFTHSDGGSFFLVGLKATYGAKSVWRYSSSTGNLVTWPSSGTPQTSMSSTIAPDLSQGWRGFTYEITRPGGIIETVVREVDVENYSHWRVPGGVSLTVNRGTSAGWPSPSATSHTWYVCSAEPVIAWSSPIRITLQRGLTKVNDLPADCEERGSDSVFTPSPEDAGKYPAVVVTYSNSFLSTTVFHHSMEKLTLSPRILPIEGADAPRISGLAEFGETLVYEARYSGYPAPESNPEWYRCTREFPELWSHNLPINSVEPDQLVNERKKRIPNAEIFRNWGCNLIPEATGLEYTLGEEDRGQWIVVFDTATNSVGSASIFTASTSQVEYPPYLFERLSSSPQLHCLTNAITNSFCNQFSGYQQGSTTRVHTHLHADTSWVNNNTAWIFRALPAAELTQTWYVCDRDVPRLSQTIPAHCRQVEPMASRPDIYEIKSTDWGSWVVTMYTATNRLGTLALVPSRIYLNGQPYETLSSMGSPPSIDITDASWSKDVESEEIVFEATFRSEKDDGALGFLVVNGQEIELSALDRNAEAETWTATWRSAQISDLDFENGELRGIFEWNGKRVGVAFEDSETSKLQVLDIF